MIDDKQLNQLRKTALKSLWRKENDRNGYRAAIESGLPVDDFLGYGSPPSLWAAKEGNLDWCRFFVSMGAHPGWILTGLVGMAGVKENDTEFTSQRTELVKALLADDPRAWESPIPGRSTPLSQAIRWNIEWALDLLLADRPIQNGDLIEECELQRCAHFGNDRLVERLLSAGVDPNSPGWCGNRALHEYCYVGKEPQVALLLDKGADPNGMNEAEETPLWISAVLGQLECTRRLLQAGGNPNTRKKGMLLLSRVSKNNHSQVAALLAEYGASLEARNGRKQKGKNSLQVAQAVGGAVSSRLEAHLINGVVDQVAQESNLEAPVKCRRSL